MLGLRRLVIASVALALSAGTITGVATAGAASVPVQIKTLSVRADLVSGGQVLTQVVLPPKAKGVHVTLNGNDVTAEFARRANGKYEGLLTGLRLGRNQVVAKLRSGRGARLTITDHPVGGPTFSGPQIQPWACQAGAKDAQCDEPATLAYYYQPKGSPASVNAAGSSAVDTLRPYDPSNPPSASSIATASTTDGVNVPFIVRLETGYIDRDQYQIAVLWQPGKPWAAWAPQKQFNHRLVIMHGASCDTTYGTGSAPSVLDTKVLGGGFVVMSHALDNAGHNCNIATQAESLVMTKQHVIDTYGELRWTIGSGCSGGSLVQQQVANAYPGIYQGITPQCSFTDAWSSAMQYVDYTALLKYFETPSRWSTGVAWDPVAISAVLDHPNIGNPVTFTTVIPNSADPSRSCPSVPKGQVYDPKTNPKGVKCTLQDYMVNVYGKRPDGFANRAFGNDGIQYGLNGLLDGELSARQFVDLNTHLGGFDYNDDLTPDRTKPDAIAVERAYRSGAVDSANNLNQVAIIDLRGPDPGAFHDVYRTYAMRARLLRDFGTAANQVLWRGQAPLIGDAGYADQAVFAMDHWLGRVDADRRNVPLPQKIIEDKPGDLTDRCTDGAGTDIPSYECDAVVQAYGTPRQGAGGPLAEDTLECQKKPLDQADYPAGTFTIEQWAALNIAFPDGVCDYSKPGVSQHGATAWLTYQDAKGHVVYGGTPLGSPPVSKPFRR
ncbi:MAG TPA: DUF6351 family protein [Mycobacteriales bacterium]|nr:DUF6351 family protein [Mycobacteriales bacterium]